MFDDTYRADENGLAKSQMRNPSEKEAAGPGLSPEHTARRSNSWCPGAKIAGCPETLAVEELRIPRQRETEGFTDRTPTSCKVTGEFVKSRQNHDYTELRLFDEPSPRCIWNNRSRSNRHDPKAVPKNRRDSRLESRMKPTTERSVQARCNRASLRA